jgi:hypothetical protein
MGDFIVFFVLFTVVWIVVGALLSEARGNGRAQGALLGGLLGVIGILIVACLPRGQQSTRPTDRPAQATQERLYGSTDPTCPNCGQRKSLHAVAGNGLYCPQF